METITKVILLLISVAVSIGLLIMGVPITSDFQALLVALSLVSLVVSYILVTSLERE